MGWKRGDPGHSREWRVDPRRQWRESVALAVSRWIRLWIMLRPAAVARAKTPKPNTAGGRRDGIRGSSREARGMATRDPLRSRGPCDVGIARTVRRFRWRGRPWTSSLQYWESTRRLPPYANDVPRRVQDRRTGGTTRRRRDLVLENTQGTTRLICSQRVVDSRVERESKV